MNYGLRFIKRYYGENMMHLCRSLFPTILGKEGILLKIMEDNFAHNKFLYSDIVKADFVTKFSDFIFDIFDSNNTKKEKKEVVKSPFELLREAGYTLYECKSEEDIQRFKKYYAIWK